jgi:hypothetical protein
MTLVTFGSARGFAEVLRLLEAAFSLVIVMSMKDSAPEYDYIAYIDESGDPGIERVRPIDNPGGTEWLVIGAAVIRASNELAPVQWVRSILDSVGRRQTLELHFRDLTDWRKAMACQKLATLPLVAFAMLSNKKNMRQHTNARAAAKSSPLTTKQVFYNYCLRLILERITDFCLRDSLRTYGSPRYVKLIFSKRGGHNYAHTFVYNEILKRQSRAQTTMLRRREIKWQVVDFRLQEDAPHTSVAGLQLADVIASAFYQAVDILPPTKWDPHNAKLLRPRMAREAGFWRDYGVAFQPSPQLTKANLLPSQKDIFEFYGYDRREFDVPW